MIHATILPHSLIQKRAERNRDILSPRHELLDIQSKIDHIIVHPKYCMKPLC